MSVDELHRIFMQGLEKRLISIYQQSKSGLQPTKEERHKFEGYMDAGIEIGLVFPEKLQRYIHRRHQEYFGMSLAERKNKNKNNSKDWMVINGLSFNDSDGSTWVSSSLSSRSRT